MIRPRHRVYAAEAVGTFALVFAGTGAVVINDLSDGQVTHVGVALTFGLIVTAMIYALGEVSGAHLNPGVTCGFWLAKRFPGSRVVPYVLAQSTGALAASGLLRMLFPAHRTLGATLPYGASPHPVATAFGLEVILTAMLMFVILSVAFGSRERGVMAGLAIGGVVALEALFAGPISGASMNPARSLAPALVSGLWVHQWIYVLAPLAGVALAVAAWRWVHAPDASKPVPEAQLV